MRLTKSKAGVKSILFKGNEATEACFKKLGDYKTESPQVIHISTHGYFFRPESQSSGTMQVFNKNQFLVRASNVGSVMGEKWSRCCYEISNILDEYGAFACEQVR